jgi:CHAT domain-containing protein
VSTGSFSGTVGTAWFERGITLSTSVFLVDIRRSLAVFTVVALALVSVRAGSSHDRTQGWGSADLVNLARAATDAWYRGKLEESERLFREGYRRSLNYRSTRGSLRFLNGVASCQLAAYRYRLALESYSRVRTLAFHSGDLEIAALASFNISSVYLQLFDYQSAQQTAAQAVRLLPFITGAKQRSQALLQLAWLKSFKSRPREAIGLFERSIFEAALTDDGVVESSAWNRLGAELMRTGDLAAAEQCLNTAFRIRLLSKDPNLFITRFQMAELKLAQHRLTAARTFIDSAIETASGSLLPHYRLLDLRARIREAQGDSPGAIKDFRAAMKAAALWRGQVIPADSFRTSADSGLQEVYDAFIDAAASGGSASLMVEAWQAAEVNRAASLREATLESTAWRDKLGSSYWEMLAQVRSLEARNLSTPSPVIQARIAELRLVLTELEFHVGLPNKDEINFSENFSPQISLSSLQKVLGNSRILISFHLGDRTSYRWDTSTTGLRVTSLPAAKVLNNLATKFRNAILQNEPNAVEVGRRLYSTLFDKIEADNGATWLLALEGNLFEIPVAALVTGGTAGRPHYLIEDRAVEVVPGAWAVGANDGIRRGDFLGIGDAIYNHADPRFENPARADALPLFSLLSTFSNWGHSPAELPRLLGSGREVEQCARSWNGPSRLLVGADVTRRKLEQALATPPAAVHIAAHFVPTENSPDRTMVAFSLQAGTAASTRPFLELLTNTDISALRVPGSLVVLSGCSSAAGKAAPGAGLLGLTRAWMSAGATHVIATHWPTPDDSGELFTSFYHHLRAERPVSNNAMPAIALRMAQLDMMRLSGWRASPRYWAAYQLTGRSEEAP